MSSASANRLILASSSIYRRQLLTRLGIPFDVVSPDVDEAPMPNEGTLALAIRLAKAKAAAVAKLHPKSWVIGSDQVADLYGAAIGKPGNFERAMAQLQLMRGNTVTFHTALCLMHNKVEITVNVPTQVASTRRRLRLRRRNQPSSQRRTRRTVQPSAQPSLHCCHHLCQSLLQQQLSLHTSSEAHKHL